MQQAVWVLAGGTELDFTDMKAMLQGVWSFGGGADAVFARPLKRTGNAAGNVVFWRGGPDPEITRPLI